MSHKILVAFFSLLLVTGVNTAYAAGGKPHVKKEKPVKVKKDRKHHHHHRNHRWH